MRARTEVRPRRGTGRRASDGGQRGSRPAAPGLRERTNRAAIETLDRVAQATTYTPTVTYPNSGFGLALRTVAGAIVRGIGSRVFWVQTGGFDTHAQQGAAGGAYGNLMGTLGDGLWSFYSDVRNQGLANDTTVIVFSEFGRRISENGSRGHRSRRSGRDDGARRHGARRPLRHRGVARARASDAREQLRRHPLRDRLPVRLRKAARPVARRELRPHPQR